jgi:hypothetical protein
MKAQTKPGWQLTHDQREHLALLLSEVPRDAGEDDPALLRLLDAWEACRAPWDLRPGVCSYRARGGAWLHAGVTPALTSIRYHTLN